MYLENFLEWIYASRSRTVAIAFMLVAATGFLDYITGYAMAFSLFYLLPVLLVAHVFGKRVGFMMAGLTAGTWTLAQEVTNLKNFNWLESAWNILMRLGVLVVVTYLLLAFKAEMRYARYDYLTHLNNRRQFMQAFEVERNRSTRTGKPYSILYLDIDHFKTLNDTQGHAAGDEALRVVAMALRIGSRRMDIPARIGGDEFAVLLPDTDTMNCRLIAERIDQAISGEFEKRKWPIGISIGMATAYGIETTIEEILHTVDRAMYQAKYRKVRREPS
ncbi:MAG: GGDEF domain-containing protein [Candidatus Contendobacter sp.]|nr:GGDEF domain-containing protein [Candidatus Contendobacter sp.]